MNLLFFHTKTCKQCRRQEEEFENNPPLLPIRKIDVFSEVGPSMMRKYHVHDVPSTLLVDECGRAIHVFFDFHSTLDMESWMTLHGISKKKQS